MWSEVRGSNLGNPTKAPETVTAAAAAEGPKRERAQNSVEDVLGVGQAGIVPAAPRTGRALRVGNRFCRFFLFFLDLVFPFVLDFVLRFLFRICVPCPNSDYGRYDPPSIASLGRRRHRRNCSISDQLPNTCADNSARRGALKRGVDRPHRVRAHRRSFRPAHTNRRSSPA